MTEYLLQIQNVSFSYPQGKLILKDVSLSVSPGETVCLLGESGSGKSTLIRLIQRLHQPIEGTIQIADIANGKFEIATVSQNYTLFPHLNALQNVTFVLRRSQGFFDRIRPDLKIEQQANYYLKQVGMELFAKQYPHTLSGGQKQRVAIAQALAQQSQLILLDEPLGALDQKIRDEIQNLLINLQKEYNFGVLFITHDLKEALYLAKRLYVLRKDEDGCSTIEEYPIIGKVRAAPEAKLIEHSAKQEQSLSRFLFRRQGNPLSALSRGLIDENDLAEIERLIDTIWVITPDLNQDVYNQAISESVEKNLESGKKYTYFVPFHDNEKVRYNINMYTQRFEAYKANFSFYNLPDNDLLFLFGETVLYNPDKPDPSGYTYLHGNEKGMMIALPDKFVRGCVERCAEEMKKQSSRLSS